MEIHDNIIHCCRAKRCCYVTGGHDFASLVFSLAKLLKKRIPICYSKHNVCVCLRSAAARGAAAEGASTSHHSQGTTEGATIQGQTEGGEEGEGPPAE